MLRSLVGSEMCIRDSTYTENINLCEESTKPSLSRNIEAQEINIYPNPASNFITVSGFEAVGDRLVILDMNGRVLYTIDTEKKDEIKVDISGLDSGVYFIQNRAKTFNSRFIKI